MGPLGDPGAVLVLPDVWPMSKPAQNALPLPVSTITLTARSVSASSRARWISASRFGDSAFIRSGRLRVMVAMRSLTR